MQPKADVGYEEMRRYLMGLKLLSTVVGPLAVMGVIDFFVSWYSRFLQNRMPDARIRTMLGRFVWAMLAGLFWILLYSRGLPQTFGSSYFLFVLFIYSVHGLIAAFFKKNAKD